jgi:hypothetical protein
MVRKVDVTVDSSALTAGAGPGLAVLREARPELVATATEFYGARAGFLAAATLDLVRRGAAAALGSAGPGDLAVRREGPDFDPRQRVVLGFVDQFCHSAQGVTDQHFVDLAAHFSAEQIFAVAVAVSLVERFYRLTAFAASLAEGAA